MNYIFKLTRINALDESWITKKKGKYNCTIHLAKAGEEWSSKPKYFSTRYTKGKAPGHIKFPSFSRDWEDNKKEYLKHAEDLANSSSVNINSVEEDFESVCGYTKIVEGRKRFIKIGKLDLHVDETLNSLAEDTKIPQKEWNHLVCYIRNDKGEPEVITYYLGHDLLKDVKNKSEDLPEEELKGMRIEETLQDVRNRFDIKEKDLPDNLKSVFTKIFVRPDGILVNYHTAGEFNEEDAKVLREVLLKAVHDEGEDPYKLILFIESSLGRSKGFYSETLVRNSEDLVRDLVGNSEESAAAAASQPEEQSEPETQTETDEEVGKAVSVGDDPWYRVGSSYIYYTRARKDGTWRVNSKSSMSMTWEDCPLFYRTESDAREATGGSPHKARLSNWDKENGLVKIITDRGPAYIQANKYASSVRRVGFGVLPPFIPLHEDLNEGVALDNPWLKDAVTYLKKYPHAYGYICSYKDPRTHQEVGVRQGFMTKELLDKKVKDIINFTNTNDISAIYSSQLIKYLELLKQKE